MFSLSNKSNYMSKNTFKKNKNLRNILSIPESLDIGTVHNFVEFI